MSAAMRTAPPQVRQGVLFVIAAVGCFAALDTSVKINGAAGSVAGVMWVRYAFQTVLTLATQWPRHGRGLLRTRNPRLQVLRGLLVLGSSVCAFFSLRHLPVGEFTALVMLSPLAVTMLAALSLGDRISWLRWATLAGGFAGALIVIRPDGNDVGWAALMPLGVIATTALYQVLTSRLVRIDDAATMQFYTGLVGMVAASCALPFVWSAIDLHVLSSLAVLLVMLGLFSTIGHHFMIMAHARAPVAALTPFLYFQIGFATIAGWLVFSHRPDAWTILGIATIASCGAAGTWLATNESRVLGAAGRPALSKTPGRPALIGTR